MATKLSKPRVYSDEEWELQHCNFAKFYVDEGLPLTKVIEAMKTQHGFHATPRQYKTRIKKWGLEKKLKTNEMLAIVHLDKKRKREGKVTAFRVRKRTVQEEKMKRFVREHPRVCDASFSSSVASLSVISYNTTEDHSRTFRPMGQNLNIPADAPAIAEAPSESQSLVVRPPEVRSPHIEARIHDRAWFIVSWITGDRAYQNDAPFDQRQKHFVAQNYTSRSSTTDLASMKEFSDFSAAARTTSISSSSGSKPTDDEPFRNSEPRRTIRKQFPEGTILHFACPPPKERPEQVRQLD